MWKKILIVLPYVVLAFVLFVIFAKKSEYKQREAQYQEQIREYTAKVKALDSRIEYLEGNISQYKDSISALEETKRSLEKRLQHIKQENEKTVAHIISSDTDWNIRFLSDYLSEENSL